ncbi:MAG TPA: VOC family protein [Candidatus Thermoplasmatota archaeon]|nr:VOC family protein [Candidatus Thermoplasmatota archaeon]
MVRLSHVNVAMPPGQEAAARAFYRDLLGMTEVPKPEPMRTRGGVWFDAGGLDVHVSPEEEPREPDGQRHFGLEVKDVEAMRTRLEAAGHATDAGRPVPWRRFFSRDPFGNRIEFHEVGGLRG